jgi:seryl-tRNA synthetase
MTENDKEVGRLDGTLQSMNQTLNNLSKVLLLGNGQPSLIERQARIEENMESTTQTLKQVAEKMSELNSTVLALSNCIETHIKDSQVHTAKGLLMRKDVIPFLILVAIVLHSIIPDDLTIWSVLSKFFGL